MSSAPATGIDATWLCGLLQAGDSFYPTGSYAHSFGLEGLVQEGVIRDRDSLRQFIRLSAVPALRHADLPIAAHAWRAFAIPDWTALAELAGLSSALKAPREIRLASENIGRQRAELVHMLHGSRLAGEFLQRAAVEKWPHSAAISAALEGRTLGAPVAAVLAGLYYAAIASLLSAAMKVLRLGQNASQGLLTETLTQASATIAVAANTPLADIGWFNPWLDIASARHEAADSRMFIS